MKYKVGKFYAFKQRLVNGVINISIHLNIFFNISILLC